MKRKWERVITDKEVYCSSTGHYHTDVWLFDENNGRAYRYYLINAHSFISLKYGSYIYTPKYVEAEVRRQLQEKLTSGQLTVFENNRDGRKRTDNLRYHDPDYLARLLEPKVQP